MLRAFCYAAHIDENGGGPGSTRKRIEAKLMTYAIKGSGDVKRLKGTQGCRLRIGDWRVIFIEDARSITVVAVDHRREIYD